MGSSPALISPVVTPLVLGVVGVLEASAAVGSASGPYLQIPGTPSPSFSRSFRWRSQIIWKWRDLNHQRSGELTGGKGICAVLSFSFFFFLTDY